MKDDNLLKRNVPPDDLKRNFNYRTYLQKNGWTENNWGGKCVLNAANPLAKEWGHAIGNRMYLSDTFIGTYLPKYYKGIIDELRRYALEEIRQKAVDHLQRHHALRGLQQSGDLTCPTATRAMTSANGRGTTMCRWRKAG